MTIDIAPSRPLFAAIRTTFCKLLQGTLLLALSATFSLALADGHGGGNHTAEEKSANEHENKPITTETSNTMITLKTSAGDIEIELDNEKAPESAKNFIAYAKEGHYDGTIFHRVIPGFMIQGGGFEPGMRQKPVKASIVNEADNGLKNDKYTVAMARTNEPHSATSQFFINAKDNDFLNYTASNPSGWGYAVFGKVTSGEDVVDSIEKVKTGQSGPFGDVPLEDVVIESVVVSE